MATQSVLDSLTRRHGVKVAAGSVEECSVAVGDVVGHECVLAASKMNNSIVLFLNTVEKANEVVDKGINIRGLFTPVLPLSTPAKKVTISNVPPFIKDEMLMKELSRFGKLIAPIKKIAIGCKSGLVKHVVSFRRFTFMILNGNRTDLDVNFKFKVDDFDYTVFVTTDTMRCFGCGKSGHLIRACPENSAQGSEQNDAVQGNAAQNKDGEVASTSNAPNSSGPKVVHVEKNVESDLTRESIEIDERNTEISEIVNSESVESNNGEALDNTQMSLNQFSDTESQVESVFQNEDTLMDMDQVVFKTPLKRKKNDKSMVLKQARKNQEGNKVDNESSEGECSDSSGSVCSQSSWSCLEYGVDEIKKFLKVTKNMRGVKVEEYFPDLRRLLENIRSLMSEGRFTDKEVYRLKKIVTKIQLQLNNDDEMV